MLINKDMPMVKMHPEIITKNGKKIYAMIPYDEFIKIQEALEDADDLRELNLATEASKDEIAIPIEVLIKKYRRKARTLSNVK